MGRGGYTGGSTIYTIRDLRRQKYDEYEPIDHYEPEYARGWGDIIPKIQNIGELRDNIVFDEKKIRFLEICLKKLRDNLLLPSIPNFIRYDLKYFKNLTEWVLFFGFKYGYLKSKKIYDFKKNTYTKNEKLKIFESIKEKNYALKDSIVGKYIDEKDILPIAPGEKKKDIFILEKYIQELYKKSRHFQGIKTNMAKDFCRDINYNINQLKGGANPRRIMYIGQAIWDKFITFNSKLNKIIEIYQIASFKKSNI